VLFIFSTLVLIRHLWQPKTVVFLHRCLILAVLLGQTSADCHAYVTLIMFEWKILFSYEKLWYQIEVISKFGMLKNICFQLLNAAKGFDKIWHQFWSFCMNGNEQNDAKRHFVLKKPLFSVLKPPTTNFEWKLRDTLVVFDNIIQKNTRVYSLVQYPTVVNRIDW